MCSCEGKIKVDLETWSNGMHCICFTQTGTRSTSLTLNRSTHTKLPQKKVNSVTIVRNSTAEQAQGRQFVLIDATMCR